MSYSFGYKVAYAKYGEKLLDMIDVHFEIVDLVDAENILEEIRKLVKYRDKTIYILRDGRGWPRDLTDEEWEDEILRGVERALEKIRKVEEFLERMKWRVLGE